MNPNYQTYIATRSRWPTLTAQKTLHAIRTRDAHKHLVCDYKQASPYNPRITRKVGYSQTEHLTEERWIEDTERAGLRFVGFADELAPGSALGSGIGHTGWYLDCDFPAETYRGAVWQLPGRNGRAVYVAGYRDPFNDGAALIDFTPIVGERIDYYDDDDDAKRQAAHAADSIAQRDAETEQEYHAKWNAARRVESLLEDICETRRRHTALIRAIFTGEGDNARGAAMRESLRDRIADLIREIRDEVDTHGAEIRTAEFN